MGYVYLVQCNEFYKIGIADNPLRRIRELQTGNPIQIKLVCAYEFENAFLVESALHYRFMPVQERGEWFRLSASDIESLAQMCLDFRGTLWQDAEDDLSLSDGVNWWDEAEAQPLNELASVWVERYPSGRFHYRRRRGYVVDGGTRVNGRWRGGQRRRVLVKFLGRG